MNLTYIFLLSLLILFVIGIVFVVSGKFKPATTETVDTTIFVDQYKIPSPWNWVNRDDLPATGVSFTEDGKVVATFGTQTYILIIEDLVIISGTTESGVPLSVDELADFQLVNSGIIDNSCNVYTFLASQSNTVPVIRYSQVPSCTQITPPSNGVPGACYISEDKEGCIDDDQLYAQQRIHACQGVVSIAGLETGDTCRTQLGVQVPKNTVETYFESCKPDPKAKTTRCPGSLAFLRLGEDVAGVTPRCMVEPAYQIDLNGNVSNTTVVRLEDCSLTQFYKGFPKQLWRIRPGVYNGSTINFNAGGQFFKIVDRPTGLCLAPSLLKSGTDFLLDFPLAGQLQLIPCDLRNNGYYWYLLPTIDQPAPYENDVRLGIRQTLIYAPNPREIPGSTVELWPWIYTNRNDILSIRPSGLTAQAQPIVIVNKNDLSSGAQTLSQASVFNYIDFTYASFI